MCVLFCDGARRAMRAALRIDRGTAPAVLHQRAVRLMASNGEAGRAFFFRPFVLPARSPRFHRGGPGAAPGRATISLRKRRLSIRGRGTFALSDPPEASRRPESGRGRVYQCARGVTATWRSASPQSRVRFPARTPILELRCSTVAGRTFNPPGAGASPAGSTNLTRGH